VWVTLQFTSEVAQIDPASNEIVARIDVAVSPHAHAVAAGYLWVGGEARATTRIDLATLEAEGMNDFSFSSIDMAVDGTEVWVADAEAGLVVRFDATSAEINGTVDLAEFGDCETLREETPPPVFASTE